MRYRLEMRRNSESSEWQRGPLVLDHERTQKIINGINSDLRWMKYRIVEEAS